MYVYSKGEIMEDKLYAKDLRRAAKRLERKIEPDSDGLITIENPRIFRGKLISITDFFKR